MYTEFKVEVSKSGQHFDSIIKMISTHNDPSNKVKIDMDVINGYLLAHRAMYPPLNTGLFIKSEGENNQILHVSDDNGKTFYLTITEREMYELGEQPQGRAMLFTNTNENL